MDLSPPVFFLMPEKPCLPPYGGHVVPRRRGGQVTGFRGQVAGEIGHGGEGVGWFVDSLIRFVGIGGAKIGIILFYAVDSELS